MTTSARTIYTRFYLKAVLQSLLTGLYSRAVDLKMKRLRSEWNRLRPAATPSLPGAYHPIGLTGSQSFARPMSVSLCKKHLLTRSAYTCVSQKMCHFVFDYNSHISWSIFYNFCIIGNRNEHSIHVIIYNLFT